MRAGHGDINPLWKWPINATQRTYEADEVDGGVSESELWRPIDGTLRSCDRPW